MGNLIWLVSGLLVTVGALTEESSGSSRTQPAPTVGTPIYDGLARELAERHTVGWPVADPDPPAQRLPAHQFPDGWFTPLPDVEHTGPPTGSLFRFAMAGEL